MFAFYLNLKKKMKASCFPRPLTPKNRSVSSGPSSSTLRAALSPVSVILAHTNCDKTLFLSALLSFTCITLRLSGGSQWCLPLKTPLKAITTWRNIWTSCAALHVNPQATAWRSRLLRQAHANTRKKCHRGVHVVVVWDKPGELETLNHLKW